MTAYEMGFNDWFKNQRREVDDKDKGDYIRGLIEGKRADERESMYIASLGFFKMIFYKSPYDKLR